MLWPCLRAIAILFLSLPCSCWREPVRAQSTSLPPGTYPDNTGGLKKLAKDLLKAQKENDPAGAERILRSLIVPNFQQWYPENFDAGATSRALPQYQANASTLPAQLATFFLNTQHDGAAEVEAVRFDSNCDDNASEQTFNTLEARRTGIPLYELRFFKGDHFQRLFAFAYVDGGFRFVVTPDFSTPAPRNNASDSSGQSTSVAPTVRQGGAVTAAKLIYKENPRYPEQARNERLSGTVRLHAIVAKDGTIEELRVISGRCSLAKASIEAVRKWRYSPTLLEGSPAEVDTTIDVIFALNR